MSNTKKHTQASLEKLEREDLVKAAEDAGVKVEKGVRSTTLIEQILEKQDADKDKSEKEAGAEEGKGNVDDSGTGHLSGHETSAIDKDLKLDAQPQEGDIADTTGLGGMITTTGDGGAPDTVTGVNTGESPTDSQHMAAEQIRHRAAMSDEQLDKVTEGKDDAEAPEVVVNPNEGKFTPSAPAGAIAQHPEVNNALDGVRKSQEVAAEADAEVREQEKGASFKYETLTGKTIQLAPGLIVPPVLLKQERDPQLDAFVGSQLKLTEL